MKFTPRLLLKKYKILLFPLCAGIIILSTFIYVLLPQTRVIFQTFTKIQEQKVLLSGLEKKRTLLDSLDRESVLQNIAEVQIALPNEKEVGTVLVALDAISSKTQQGIDSISFVPGIVSSESANLEKGKKSTAPEAEIIKRNGAITIPVKVGTRGTTAQFTEFLHNLENSRRLLDIASVDVKYYPDTPDFLSADFSVLVYFLPPITQIGSFESAIIALSEEEQQIIQKVAALPNYSHPTFDTATLPDLQRVGKTNLFAL